MSTGRNLNYDIDWKDFKVFEFPRLITYQARLYNSIGNKKLSFV
jgi:hypothetical protein